MSYSIMINEDDVQGLLDEVPESGVSKNRLRELLDEHGFPVPPKTRTALITFEVTVEVEVDYDDVGEATDYELEMAAQNKGISTDDFVYCVDGVQEVTVTDANIVD